MARMRISGSKVCAEPGCPTLFDPGNDRDAYCPAHKPEAWKRRERHVNIPDRIRKAVFRRDRGKCQECGQRGTIVDHIIPEFEGGKTVLVNLQLLCTRCSAIKSAREGARAKRQARADDIRGPVVPGARA